MRKEETWTFKITAHPPFLRSLYTLLRQCESLGHIGGSRWLSIYCDGDGADQPKMECDHPCEAKGGKWQGDVFMIDTDERWDE